jgi:hypothetical protein
MPERTDYNRFKDNVPQFGDRLDRVENLCVNGMPDTNYCFANIEGWVEYKSPTEPKRETTPLFGSNHKVSQDQMNWFLRQYRAGGRCYFLIATDKRWMLLSGGLADHLNNMTVNALMENALWLTSKPVRDKQHWVALREILMR